MNDTTVSSTIEILGKIYPVRCEAAELESLQKAAVYLNEQMTAVQESGKVVDPARIAIITALNIAHQLLLVDQQKNSFIDKINQRLSFLQDKLETSMAKALQTELVYSAE